MRKGVAILIGVAVLLTIFTLVMSNIYPNSLTGRILFGSVSLYISSDGPTVIIHNPQNVTYNFAIGSNYTLDLNVSTPSSNISAWWYTLEDLFHGVVVNQSVIFNPNITFNAVRRSNKLTVYANDTTGQVGSKSVTFFVSVPNSAPLLGNITPELYACESSNLLYNFNATDIDEDNIFLSVSPASPFFVFPNSFSGVVTAYSQLFSGILNKGDVGQHNRTISVTDGEYSDSKNLSITVIEVNNAPVASEVGVQTVYTKGDQTNFFKRYEVSDVEQGYSVDGNLSFNISFNGETPLFNISSTGLMNFTANSTYLGVHNITVCATDRGLPSLSVNASFCGETGESKYVCSNFSLTVTDDNRAPTILTYFPYEIFFNATGETTIYFNITSYDPDGTVPDAYWYLQGNQVKYQQGSFDSNYSVTFPCGDFGLKTVKARVTDGIENDSISWNISLTGTVCPSLPEPSSGGGGGGGGGGPFCIPQWGCNDWTICQNTKVSLDIGVIGQTDYREITESCASFNLDESNCGYQTRSCFDNKYCNSSLSKPSFIQSCSYTSNPSCQDNMKNCHDGSCELLIDCGGPCAQCASCSDKIQNQGELGIDCGGPCPFLCPTETPFISISLWRTIIIWLFWLLLLILLIILIRRIWRLIEVHRELQKEKKIQSILSK